MLSRDCKENLNDIKLCGFEVGVKVGVSSRKVSNIDFEIDYCGGRK